MATGLNEWKQLYFPSELWNQALRDDSQQLAVWLSLRKWIGLADLESYGIQTQERCHTIYDDDSCFTVTSDTCPLCQLAISEEDEVIHCSRCVLAEVRKAPCDRHSTQADGNAKDPYRAWLVQGRPLPMIRWLGACVRHLADTPTKLLLRWLEDVVADATVLIGTDREDAVVVPDAVRVPDHVRLARGLPWACLLEYARHGYLLTVGAVLQLDDQDPTASRTYLLRLLATESPVICGERKPLGEIL